MSPLSALADHLPARGSGPVDERSAALAGELLLPLLNQAAAMEESRYATAADIDTAVRLGSGLPMGPLEVLDIIGIDTVRDALAAMYARTGDHRHLPAPVLDEFTVAGLHGRSTGRGFHRYAASDTEAAVPGTQAGSRAGIGAGIGAGTRAGIGAVGVCGSGIMAAGIAEVFAVAGHPVVLVARSVEKAERAREAVGSSLGRLVAKGRLSQQEFDTVLARITPTTELADLGEADLVIEAVAEDLEVKRSLFASLDTLCKPGAILATTTSSLSVGACAVATSRPQDVIGLHFFNPAPVMRLVEVVSTPHTAPEVVATAVELCAAVRMNAVECGDRAGFIVNALIFPYLNDAVRMVDDGRATVEEVDAAMRLVCGHHLGPFELMDIVGLDVALAIQRVLHGTFHEPSLEPAPLLAKLVAEGRLGRKSGRGFRDHTRR